MGGFDCLQTLLVRLPCSHQLTACASALSRQVGPRADFSDFGLRNMRVTADGWDRRMRFSVWQHLETTSQGERCGKRRLILDELKENSATQE